MFLGLLWCNSSSADENQKNNYLKWNVEFKTLNEKNKLKYCYPFFGHIADFVLYSYVYKIKSEDTNLKSFEKYSKENYVINIYKQHVIFKLLIYDELDSLSNKGDATPELRETLIKDDKLLTNSQNFLGTPNISITETEIPDLCDKLYNNFVLKNKDKLKSEFTKEKLSFLEELLIKEFDYRLKNVLEKMKE